MNTRKSKKFNRRAALARIHIIKKELGLDEAYQDMLIELTGKDSCAHMTDRELQEVLDHLSRYVAPRPRRGAYMPRSQNLRIVYAKAKKFLGENWRVRLTGLTERIASKSTPEWCTNEELVRLMAAIGKIGRRENVPPEKD